MSGQPEPPQWHFAQGPLRWSGQRWEPAQSEPPSPDGYWGSSGRTWTPTDPPRGWQWNGHHAWVRTSVWPPWFKVRLAWWSAALVTWVPASGIGVALGHSGIPLAIVLLSSLLLAIVFSVSFGYSLGRQRLWRLLGAAIPIGTAVLMAAYAVAMIAFNPSDPNADTSAGAGLVVLSVPTAALLAILLFSGAAVARLQGRGKTNAV